MPNVYISLGVHGFFRDAPTTLYRKDQALTSRGYNLVQLIILINLDFLIFTIPTSVTQPYCNNILKISLTPATYYKEIPFHPCRVLLL